MEASGTCEIERLPEELLSAVLSLTTPRDACRAAGACRDFRAAADSDAVWSRFLPRDLPPLADDGELSAPPPSSEKGRFLRLCDRPVLLADGLTSMWLDRESGAKCYMLSARKLNIAWGDTPCYWRWMPIQGSSFSVAAKLLFVRWLEIRGKIDSKMLSHRSAYAAYMVFKVAYEGYGLCSPYPETSVTLGASKSTRSVCLDEDGDPDRRGRGEIPRKVMLPRERGDGWMELEMGEFHNDEGQDGEVSIKLLETSGTVKCGLIVQGIEIRPKKRDHHRASSSDRSRALVRVNK